MWPMTWREKGVERESEPSVQADASVAAGEVREGEEGRTTESGCGMRVEG